MRREPATPTSAVLRLTRRSARRCRASHARPIRAHVTSEKYHSEINIRRLLDSRHADQRAIIAAGKIIQSGPGCRSQVATDGAMLSMGVNWDSGLIYWKDHAPSVSERYSLSHLHPFIRGINLPSSSKHAGRSVQLHVSFGLHTFTRAVELRDSDDQLYRDNREVRTFCPERHARSLQLPHIIRTL